MAMAIGEFPNASARLCAAAMARGRFGWEDDPTARGAGARRHDPVRALCADADFYSLQKGEAGAHAAQKLHMIDWTAELTDFAATAALVENLDLIISVDTSVAHLAGAMAKDVWVMLPHLLEWRWLNDREDS